MGTKSWKMGKSDGLPVYGENVDIRNGLFVGGYSGSGTRVLVRICESFGFFVGQTVLGTDVSTEAHDFRPLSTTTGWRVRHGWRSDFNHYKFRTNFYSTLKSRWIHEFDKLEKYTHWCLKRGDFLPLFPVLRETFPTVKQIAVVRNGLDNILNEFPEVYNYGRYVLPEYIEDPSLEPSLEGRALLWNRWHADLVGYQADHPDICAIFRLEDLVEDTKAQVERLFEFLEYDISGQDIKEKTSWIERPKSIGRHRRDHVINLKKDRNKFIDEEYDPESDAPRLFEVMKEPMTDLGYGVLHWNPTGHSFYLEYLVDCLLNPAPREAAPAAEIASWRTTPEAIEYLTTNWSRSALLEALRASEDPLRRLKEVLDEAISEAPAYFEMVRTIFMLENVRNWRILPDHAFSRPDYTSEYLDAEMLECLNKKERQFLFLYYTCYLSEVNMARMMGTDDRYFKFMKKNVLKKLRALVRHHERSVN